MSKYIDLNELKDLNIESTVTKQLILCNTIFINMDWYIFNTKVCTFGWFMHLTKLHISDTTLSSNSLEFVKLLSNLTDLGLYNIKLYSPYERKSIISECIPKNNKIKSLNLSDNFWLDDLSFLIQVPFLQVLNISETPVTDEVFSKIVHCKNIRKLIIFDTDISDKSIPQLLQLKMLKEMDITDTFLTNDGIKKLSNIKFIEQISDDVQVNI